ncbi:MAG: hypothetical protein ABIF10_04720 [Candidatus Woesearchaeota archaeon]
MGVEAMLEMARRPLDSLLIRILVKKQWRNYIDPYAVEKQRLNYLAGRSYIQKPTKDSMLDMFYRCAAAVLPKYCHSEADSIFAAGYEKASKTISPKPKSKE